MGRYRYGGAEGVGLEKKVRDGLIGELRAVVGGWVENIWEK